MTIIRSRHDAGLHWTENRTWEMKWRRLSRFTCVELVGSFKGLFSFFSFCVMIFDTVNCKFYFSSVRRIGIF